ncbi:uncharacterized protein [Tenebrio molitor]|uniref:uncharacterized protein n=1 Tax=Tenebrio molitor TaxID=7067 RepID=UPI0036247A61
MIIRCAYFSVLPGTLFFDMQPFTTGSLPSRCYVPEGWFTGLIVLFWYVSCLSTTSMPMADGLFFSFAVSLIVQFKLLRHKFKNMKLLKNQSEVKVWNELKQLVDHHNFLLSRVADAIYTSQWYEMNNNEFRKCLVVILIKAQKAIIFSGYGIVYINLQTFVVVSF